MRGLLVFLILISTLASALTLGKTPLDPESRGAGCHYFLAGDDPKTAGVVAQDPDDDSLRIILDGKPKSLAFVTRRAVNQVKDEETVGDSLVERYKTGAVEVLLRLKTDQVLDEQEGWNFIQYKGTLFLNAGGKKKSFPIAGECGFK